jgi:serine/threonine protein kinase
MPKRLTCPQGHEWLADNATLFGTDEALICPHCGATFQALPAVEAIPPPPDGSRADIDRPLSDTLPEQLLELPLAERHGVPGYEILGELGRGGMGVVYRARQTNLHRLVALKMILSGVHAAAAELNRFRIEAQAIARLQHPNILQIYHVGECDGLPFLSLEFCAGGSLHGKLAGTPLPPSEATALLAKLAAAMHAAHQQGVIHRDLKPANVLFLEDGTPKIADFGLAKKLDEASQPRSGAIMGTPSYMAPEQAANPKNVGPATDVYALGAILYECLTGRPPFRAATPMDTVMQVLSEEPVPPSRLNTKVPRDLETICLKCLQKEPHKRYVSAQELAEDLRRFHAGEPIRARPVSGWERAVKWVRRRPTLAALSGLSALSLLALLLTALVYNARLQAALMQAHNNAAESEQNFQLAQQVVDKFFTQVSEKKLRDVPGFQPIRQELLQSALDYYQDFARRHGEDAKLQAEVARALFRVAVIERELGHADRALAANDRALEVLDPLLSEQPADYGLRREQVKNYCLIAFIHWYEEDGDRKAYSWYKKALPILTELLAEEPGDSETRKYLAAVYDNLGQMRPLISDEQADDYLRKGWEQRQELVRRQPGESYHQYLLAGSWINLGQFNADPKHSKVECLDKAAAILQELVRTNRRDFTYRKTLGVVLTNIGGELLNQKQTKEALVSLRRGWDVLEPLARENPAVPEFQHSLADNCNNLANGLKQDGQLEEAFRIYQRGQEAIEQPTREHPENVYFAKTLGILYSNQGDALSQLGRHREALSAYAAARKWQWDADRLFIVAQEAASSISYVGKKEKGAPSSSEEHRLQEDYAREAVAALEKALDKGFINAATVRADKVFAPLHKRRDFQDLMQKLATKEGAKKD